MGNELSDEYEYFRTLVIAGFLECRKNIEYLSLLVQVMLDTNYTAYKMPCFFGNSAETILKQFRQRFFPDLSDEEVVEKIDGVYGLTENSANNSRTLIYDRFQKLTNGIF